MKNLNSTYDFIDGKYMTTEGGKYSVFVITARILKKCENLKLHKSFRIWLVIFS